MNRFHLLVAAFGAFWFSLAPVGWAQDEAPVEEKEAVAPAEMPPPEVSESTAGAQPYDVGIFVGSLRPVGGLKDYVDPATSFGIAAGKRLCDHQGSYARGALSVSNRAKLSAKYEDQTGSLELMAVKAHVEYGLKTPVVQPVAGFGVGYYLWTLDVSENGLNNKKDGKDPGFFLSVGADYRPMAQLSIAPELAYQWIKGDFGQALMSLGLNLRWVL